MNGEIDVKRHLAIGLCLLLLSACSSWKQVGGREGYTFRGFSVDIPSHWMQLDTDRDLLLSRDGPFLQYILVQQSSVDRSFQNTKKRFREGMLPQEAAEVVVADMTSDRALRNFHLLASDPVCVDGHDGFRLVFTYQNPDGLTYKTIYYGFIAGGTYYSIRYNAAERHYFEKDLGTFQQVLGSFHIAKEMTT